MTDIPSGFEKAQFGDGFLESTGPYYSRRRGGGLIIGLRIAGQHMNSAGMVHGGMLATLADVTLAQQIHVHEDPSIPMVTNSLTTNFLNAGRLGDWMEGHGQIDRIGGRIAYTSGQITCGDSIIMTMTGVFTLLRKR